MQRLAVLLLFAMHTIHSFNTAFFQLTLTPYPIPCSRPLPNIDPDPITLWLLLRPFISSNADVYFYLPWLSPLLTLVQIHTDTDPILILILYLYLYLHLNASLTALTFPTACASCHLLNREPHFFTFIPIFAIVFTLHSPNTIIELMLI